MTPEPEFQAIATPLQGAVQAPVPTFPAVIPTLRPAAPPFLYLLRSTRHFPRFKGLSFLLRCYRGLFPAGVFGHIHDFDGNLSLEVNVCETIGINLWHAPKVYERVERQLFCAALKPRCNVLDIGANIGIYTLLASKRGARVFAVEADPANANVLRQNLERNGLADRVDIHQMAATDCPASLRLHRNPFNSGGSSVCGKGDGVRVQGRTIDSLGLPPIDICKMDIEGSELPALRGMRETIRRSPHMKLLMECSRDQSELLEFLREHFKHISIVGTGELKNGSLPAYCNLWASN